MILQINSKKAIKINKSIYLVTPFFLIQERHNLMIKKRKRKNIKQKKRKKKKRKEKLIITKLYTIKTHVIKTQETRR